MKSAPNDRVPGEAELKAVAAHFDPVFYRKANPAIAGTDADLLLHYMTSGWKEGLDPSPEFSTSHYLTTYPDIARHGANPLLHYVLAGRKEGRRPKPPSKPATAPVPLLPPVKQADLNAVGSYFDPMFYRAANPSLPGTDDDLLRHYMTVGWKAGLDPSRLFSTSHYLRTYPDIADGGLNPLLHYVLAGKAEGRQALPQQGASGASAPRPAKIAEMEAVAPYFDAAFYRKSNPDLPGTDTELLQHFMSIGWKEGYDPSPDFSTSEYIERYPDIGKNGLNPFIHYVLFGRREGRRPKLTGPIAIKRSPVASAIPAHLRPVMAAAVAAGPTPQPPAILDMSSLDIHWVIPDFARGGGGHMTIFRMVQAMEQFGHRCTIWIETNNFHASTSAAYDDIVKYYKCVGARVGFVQDGLLESSGDVIIATSWTSAYLVEAAKGFAAKFYFVQDHEPEFYPTGTESNLARHSYDFDLACICASPWLEDIMTGRYGRWARHFHLAYDHNHYRITDKDAHAKRFESDRTDPVKIAVYARGHTSRRCVTLALMALEMLGLQGAPFEVHFFGQDDQPYQALNYPAYDHGVLDAGGLARLYNECDIGICFSGTNYSLVPQEMMACGLPVVELDTESTRKIFPEGVVTFSGPAPQRIAEDLSRLIEHPELRKAQAEAALNWVEPFTWHRAAHRVESAITDYIREKKITAAPAVKRPHEALLDVIIPTYNGLADIQRVIDALRRQTLADTIQIHCIDSSSSDGTREWLKRQKDVALTIIPQHDFQHGRTRNWGAAQGSASLIAMLTQDAPPATEFWAHDIIQMFSHFPDAAGLFGRHLPYPHHPVDVREDITRHFDNMLKHPLALSRRTSPEKWERGDIGWRQILHYYSDNNSTMRRRVWNEIPYPEIPYGEDQVWARTIIEAGYVKLYAPTATVFHSHDYGPEETFTRCRTESEFFFTHFGYRLGSGTDEQIAGRIKREQDTYRRKAMSRGTPPGDIEKRLANIDAKHRGWHKGLLKAEEAVMEGEAIGV